MTDRTDPTHTWTGNDNAASNNDVADAVTHMKAWFTKEVADIKTAAGTTVTALEARVVDLEAKMKATAHPVAPTITIPTPAPTPTPGTVTSGAPGAA